MSASATRARALYIWGKVSDARLGMSVAGFTFGPSALAMGPGIPPTRHPHVAAASQVVCRAAKSVALTAEGEVWSWGSCQNLSLGHGGNVSTLPRPKRVDALAGIRITAIDAGDTSTAALSDEGELYTWGWGGSMWGGNGGLGHGDDTSQLAPALVESFVHDGIKLKAVAVGTSHMLGLSTEGTVFSWGNCEYGRCGNGKSKQKSPQVVDLLADKKVVAVAAGYTHSLALDADGYVWVWGKNHAGQLGVGGTVLFDLNTMEEYPMKIELEGDDAHRFNGQVVAIAGGSAHSLAITRDGTVFQWGQSTFLQPSPVEFGYLKPQADEEAPSKEKDMAVRLHGVGIAAGDGVSAIVTQSGDLFTWGKNLNTGTLGHTIYGMGTRLPTRVDSLHGKHVRSVSIGVQHAAAVCDEPLA